MTFAERTLLQWVDERDAGRGLRFAGAGDAWDFWSYATLSELTLRCAAALTERGVRRDDVVATIQRSSPGFVASLFGTLAAGATACSIAPPFAFQRADDYERHLGHLLATARPAAVVADEDSIGHIRTVAQRLGLRSPVLFDELVAGVAPAAGPDRPADTALLQFTSGSSGFARGVHISGAALQHNVSAMRQWLDWSADSSGITWLPVHHDMGLIGCLTNIVVTGADGWMMQPEDFIRSPMRYLRCISDQRIGLAAMPNFGLAYILRRVRTAQLDGVRLDSLRSIILGAERIDPRVLEGIEQLLEPYGFDRTALLPAYGGAEATLAVTGLPRGEGWRTGTPLGSDEPVVGCGRPLRGISVSIVDDQGQTAPDGTVGEIVVTGPSVATGYSGDAGTASGTALDAGVLRSGDAGFLHDGQLYVLGRLGDGLKVRGRMVFAESLEVALFERGLPERRVAVLLGVLDGAPTGVLVLEGARTEWVATAMEVLREALDDARLLLADVPRGGLAVTSSGKPRRRVMWQALCDGSLAGDLAPIEERVGAGLPVGAR